MGNKGSRSSLDPSMEARYLQACGSGTLVTLFLLNLQGDKDWLLEHIDPSWKDSHSSPLDTMCDGNKMYGSHLAAESGHAEVLELLMQNKLSLFHTTIRGNTALHIAARSNQGECAKILLRYGNSFHSFYSYSSGNAMWIRVRLLWIANHHPPEDSLLNMLPKDIIGEISLALSRDCVSFNKLLEITNSEVGHSRAFLIFKGATALELAMRNRAHKVIPHLVSPFTVNSIRSVMGSPLHFAADCGATAACKLLLELGCEMNKLNHRGETGLYRACCSYPENEECVKVFLDFGADPWLADLEGKTALDMARSRKYWNCVDLLEERMEKCKSPNFTISKTK